MDIERIVPGTMEWDAYYANHITRYQFAAEILSKTSVQNILDAACGVGYGSRYLSQELTGVFLTAIDRSLEALSIAKAKFDAPAIRFIEDDCHTLIAAGKFGPYDAIVSFETLEHLPKPQDFLKSCFSNLKNGGKIIVSTPNQLVSSPGNNLNWAYHEKEYTSAELYTLMMAAGFVNIQLYGQQFNQKGKIKNEVRADLNRLWSNPIVRFGRWIQKVFRGRKFEPVLKEMIDDFEIVSFQKPEESDKLNLQGPFVLIAVAEKQQ